MKSNLKILLISAVFAQIILGQSRPISNFKISNVASASLSEEPGLRSNIINSIVLQGDKTTWIGTGQGMAILHDSTSIFSLDTMHLVNEEP